MKNEQISIEGMHCASCATNIENLSKTLPGIKSMVVNFSLQKARFLLMKILPIWKLSGKALPTHWDIKLPRRRKEIWKQKAVHIRKKSSNREITRFSPGF